MPTLFGTTLGQSGRLRGTDYDAVPALVSIDGLFTDDTVLLTSVGFNQSAGVQFMQTLSRVIYVYAFGERMGAVQVSGAALWNPCRASIGSGLATVLRYYKRNSVSVRERPLDVNIGTRQAISGYLRNVTTTFSNPEQGIIGFTLTLSTMPDMWG